MSDFSDEDFDDLSEDNSDLETDIDSSEEDENIEDQHAPIRMPWIRVFQPEPREENRREFVEDVGGKEMPPANSNPIVYFYLLLTLDFLRSIVTETNRYASEFIASRDRIRRFSRLHDWYKFVETSLTEIKGFLAVILNMGIIRKPSFNEYWNTKFSSQETGWFRKMFSRNRFQNILKFFHLFDNNNIPDRNNPNYSPTSKFQCFVDLLNTQSQRYYVPNQTLSIDESLIGTRGRTQMLQYIPSKAAKFGVKLWVLVESVSGYMMHINVYIGRRYDPTPVGTTQGSLVVNTLLRSCDLMGKFYHVVCDNFFTSINLARDLLRSNTYLTGTMRSNRPMPNLIKNAKLNENESIYARQGHVLLCSFRQTARRKPVKVLSTKELAINGNNGKPELVTFYNKYMGGVDMADAMVTYYDTNRKTLKVWKKVVFNLLQRFVINAYILYTSNSSDRPLKSRLQFIQSIIEDLASEHLEGREHHGVNLNRQDRRYRRITIRKLADGRVKECSVCSDRDGFGGRRRSRTICRSCEKGLHKDCVANHLCIES